MCNVAKLEGCLSVPRVEDSVKQIICYKKPSVRNQYSKIKRLGNSSCIHSQTLKSRFNFENMQKFHAFILLSLVGSTFVIVCSHDVLLIVFVHRFIHVIFQNKDIKEVIRSS